MTLSPISLTIENDSRFSKSCCILQLFKFNELLAFVIFSGLFISQQFQLLYSERFCSNIPKIIIFTVINDMQYFCIFLFFHINLFTRLFLWIQRQRKNVSLYIQSLIVYLQLFTTISVTSNQFLMKYTSTIGEPIL